jgi:hypothetical protein
MNMNAVNRTGCRELTAEETLCVAGGDKFLTYRDGEGTVITERWSDDFSTFYGLSADYSDASANWFASLGFAALIGISFEFGGNGLLPSWGDVSFTVGIGGYLDFGVASNQTTAQTVAQGGDDYVFFGAPDGGISGDFGGVDQYIAWSGGAGIMAADDQDPN